MSRASRRISTRMAVLLGLSGDHYPRPMGTKLCSGKLLRIIDRVRS